MGREKINLINLFATMGFHLLLSDVDTVWQRDPLPYFDRFPAADILSSSDVTHPTHEDYAQDQGLEEPSAVRFGCERADGAKINRGEGANLPPVSSGRIPVREDEVGLGAFHWWRHQRLGS